MLLDAGTVNARPKSCKQTKYAYFYEMVFQVRSPTERISAHIHKATVG